MRHLRSILYALVLAPAVWILCGVGFDQDLTGRARDNGGIESLSGVLLLVLAGTAYAILLFSPISPLGPLLAGLAFLGVGAWARIAPASYAGVWPENVASDGFDQDLTGRARDNGGIESLSGVLLLVLAGTAYAILLFSPISPLGPLLAGLAFLGVGAWARIAPASYAGVWPENVASDGFDLSRPGYGLAVLLAVPLLGTALSARRWRGFEPPEILFVGTIGRARGAAAVAGTPMASERTAVIPQQRPGADFVPGFGGHPADATQVIGQGQTTVAQPTVTLPGGSGTTGSPAGGSQPADEDEKTTVMRLGPQPVREEPTQTVTAAAEEPTEAVAQAGDEPTQAVDPAAEEPTQAVTSGGEEATAEVAAREDATVTISGLADPTGDISAPEETTRDVVAGEADEDKTTLLALPAATGPAGDDGDEKTQLLTLPKADGPAPDMTDRGERTQVIRAGTVEPPGDRTQLLSFPAPAEPVTVATPVTAPDERTTSIVAAERPDPGEDPTTRLTPTVEPPGEATTRANADRPPTTVTSLERPADEAADDTRPLRLPGQRPPAEDDSTHRL